MTNGSSKLLSNLQASHDQNVTDVVLHLCADYNFSFVLMPLSLVQTCPLSEAFSDLPNQK